MDMTLDSVLSTIGSVLPIATIAFALGAYAKLLLERRSSTKRPYEEVRLADSSVRGLVVFVAAGALVSIGWIIASRRFLYADSSNFLLFMWTEQSFFVPNPGRWFGFMASQWMPVLAMKAGWRDLTGLATLFGVNLWINPVLAVVAMWWVSRRSVEITMVALAMVLMLFQSTYMVIDNESSVFFLLAILFFAVVVRGDYPLTALLLVVPLAFTHEVLVVAFIPALALLFLKKRSLVMHYGRTRYASLVLTLMLATLFSVWLIIQSPGGNRDGLVRGSVEVFTNPRMLCVMALFLSVLLSAFHPGDRKVAWVTGLTSLALLLDAFVNPEWLDSNSHYRYRVLNGVLAAGFFLYLFARVHGYASAPRRVPVRHMVVLAAVVFAYQGKVTYEWSRHLDLFRTELEARPGVQPFPVGSSLDEHRARQFVWGWTSPTRSVVFQAMERGEVGAIMENQNTRQWQPFEPRDPESLPDLSAYGVQYLPAVVRGPSDP